MPAVPSYLIVFFGALVALGAGGASSVYSTLTFSLGGINGALVGFLYNGTLLPMVGVIAMASLVASLIAFTMPKPRVAEVGP